MNQWYTDEGSSGGGPGEGLPLPGKGSRGQSGGWGQTLGWKGGRDLGRSRGHFGVRGGLTDMTVAREQTPVLCSP